MRDVVAYLLQTQMLEAASVGLSGSLHVHNNVLVGQLLQMQPVEGLPGACCLPV